MMLNKRERNQIYDQIVKGDLDPAEFDLEDTGDKVLISHESGSTFEFSREVDLDTELANEDIFRFVGEDGSVSKPKPAKIYYSVKAKVIDGINDAYRATDINNITVAKLPVWLSEIKATVGVPDYWEEMKRSRESIVVIRHEDIGNTLFTQDEQRQIAAKLRQIKEQIKEQFELTAEQIEQIEERLDEAAEASKRMGRKDWLLLFGGTVFNLIVTDTVTPGVAGHIFTTVVQGIAHLFMGGPPPQILG